MSVILIVLLMIVIAGVISWYLAELIVPQSEIDKIDAIGRWAKGELDQREAERRDDEEV
jgi:hypothetical protein